MTDTTVAPQLPLVLAAVEAVSVERLSPSFVRVELGSPALADFGVDGPLYDQRFKLVFPNARGELPSFEGADESWMGTWLSIPPEERGHMRTYTVRAVRGSGADTRIVVDVVLHVEDGRTGPGAAWAEKVRPGDRVVTLAPRRGMPFGGIEFVPGSATDLVLAGDETAVPAICAILEQLPADARGAAFLEVPLTADVQSVQAPEGVSVRWLPRDGAPHGEHLHRSVMEHLGRPVAGPVELPAEVDPDLWETPTYSSSGEPVVTDPEPVPHAGLYAWIAGESAVVTALRRALVKDLGIDRRQVAFMGYWRRGVAMRS